MQSKMSVVVAVALLAVSCASSRGGVDTDRELAAGVKAARAGYWQEAHFRFDKASTAKPGDADILNNLAVSLEALGRFDDALATYKKALEIEPRNTRIRRNYARFAEFYTSYARGVLPKGAFDAHR